MSFFHLSNMNNLFLCFLLTLYVSKATAFNGKFLKTSVLKCTNNTSCYQKAQKYQKALLGNDILIMKNSLLYNPRIDRYLGTLCNEYYHPDEMFWADKQLDSSKTNGLNTSYTYNSSANEIGWSGTSYTTPTCGYIKFKEYRNATYGYGILKIVGVGEFKAPGNGGYGWFLDQNIWVKKGDILTLGSHYYATSYVNYGY